MEVLSSENNSEINEETLILEITNKGNPTACSRRFTDEQIKSLESIFDIETKLEPRKKLQVAKDLGLQPRQVAIWFQNRRARGKPKQIEREYRVLKAKHDSLFMKLDDLQREKLSLELQLKELSDALEDKDSVRLVNRDVDAKDCHTNSNSIYNYMEEEEDDVVRWGEDISLLTSTPATWCNLSCGNLLDKSFCGSDWWDT